MTDTPQTATAPGVNPATVASNPNPAPAQNNPNATREAADKDALARNPATQRAAHEQVTTGAGRQVNRSSNLITNPPAPVDPDAPEKAPDMQGLPQGTIDEMNAGRRALERNRPVAQELEARRGDAPPKQA